MRTSGIRPNTAEAAPSRRYRFQGFRYLPQQRGPQEFFKGPLGRQRSQPNSDSHSQGCPDQVHH